jgi:hypothetical protein
LAIWLPTIKSRESTRFPYVQVACNNHWKALDKWYNFALDLISIKGLHIELWAPKVVGMPTLGISGFPFGIPGQKDIWMWALWRGIEYTVRGKVVASPKSGLWWMLWVRGCPWLVLTPKVLQLCTNQLVV